MNSGAVLVGEHRVVHDHLRHPGDRLGDDVLEARVDGRGHRDRVAVAGEARGHPDHVRLDRLGLRLIRNDLCAQGHRALLSVAGQQILGSGSPASRSITRRPPKAVSTSTIPGGSALTSPISVAASQPGTDAQRGERCVRGLGGDEGDHHALVGDVHRVDSKQLRGARPPPGRPGSRLARRRSPTPEARASSLSTEATPPRVASRIARSDGPGGVEQRVDRRPERAGVGVDVGLELELAAGEHDRGAVLADRAARRAPGRPAAASRSRAVRARIAPADAAGADVHAVGVPALDDLRVAGDDLDPGRLAPRRRSPRPRRAARRRRGPPRAPARGSARAAARRRPRGR